MLPRLAPLLALSFLASGSALGQSSDVVEITPVTELAAFRDASDRFADRMDEVHQDTETFVDLRESEERERLVGGYDALLVNLEGLASNQRALAVERFEDFLRRYPDAAYGSHVRYRFADLLFEDASADYHAASEAHYAKLESDDIDTLENLVEPKLDLSGPIALYERIVADNIGLPVDEQYERLDAAMLMLGFCYNAQNAVQYNPQRAMETFAALIVAAPDSVLADRAYLFLGNQLFEDGGFAEAVFAYNQVFERGPSSPYYSEAMYQLAWIHYKESQYSEAMDLFVQLLDASEQEKIDRGQESPFAPDAVQYLAYSVQDVALLDDDRSSVQVAEAHFAKVGERTYEWEAYASLADVLVRYSRHDEAVEVYRKLQDDPRWRLHPQNPEWQIAIVNLYSSGLIQDLERAGEERFQLTARYREGGEWWVANRNNPDALARARGLIESSLLDVAIEYYVRADESDRPEDFCVAAEKLNEYLGKFPIADDWYEQQWLLGNAYQGCSDLSRSSDVFAKLVKSSRYHPFADGATWKQFEVSRQVMLDTSGPPDVDAPEGEGPAPLSSDRLQFIAAADAVVARHFEPGDPGLSLPDFTGAATKKRSALLYIPGQILFHHRHYEDARTRLQAVLDHDYQAEEASYAALLIVDAYLAEGDLERAENAAAGFIVNPPGPPSATPTGEFLDTVVGTRIKRGLELGRERQFAQAAESFLTILRDYPESEYANDALHNAAFYFQADGQRDRANAHYEAFVETYPEDERVESIYYRIAGNYGATFELERAVDAYETLARKFPDGEMAVNASYNAAYLRIGLGDHLGAAKGFEHYARTHVNAPDREDVHFMAGEQYRHLDDRRARVFYKKYLKEYGITHPGHAVEAAFHIGDHEAVGALFDRIVDSGLDPGVRGHRFAARSAFPAVEKHFATLSADALSGDQVKDGELLRDRKPVEVQAFLDHTSEFLARYKSFEQITGVRYYRGMAALYWGDLGLSIDCPEDYSDEECWAYLEWLRINAFPEYEALVEVGVKELRELVSDAEAAKAHSEWIDRALVELNRREPLEFPARKVEFAGDPDVRIPAPIVPLRMESER